jgi:sulfite reductase (NADPH) hemoprotein beta-component
MYQYDAIDQTLTTERVAQYRDQVDRRLSGELGEDEFRHLRLRNGLYLQLHAYMLRVAIPYGLLSSTQLRKLAFIAREYDRGYGHFTTRQNLQYNWPKLTDTPDILAHLAECDVRPLCRGGRRRGGGCQALLRVGPPVRHPAPGILLPAEKIQDRHFRRR